MENMNIWIFMLVGLSLGIGAGIGKEFMYILNELFYTAVNYIVDEFIDSDKGGNGKWN